MLLLLTLPGLAAVSLRRNVTDWPLDGTNVSLAAGNESLPSAATTAATVEATLRDRRIFFRPPKAVGRSAETVWLVGFGRSGTTVAQSLVVEAALEHDGVFAAFEPCHRFDLFEGLPVGKDPKRTAACMRSVLQCNFDKVDMFHERRTREFVGRGMDDISSLCQQASVRVFKTIYPAPTTLGEIQTIAPARTRVIQITRDPRAVFSSMRHTPDFAAPPSSFAQSLCGKMVGWNGEKKQGGTIRVLPVLFEDLVTKAVDEVGKIVAFLEWQSTPRLDHYLRTHFSPEFCPGQYDAYGTCRTRQQTQEIITKWQHTLTAEEKLLFSTGVCKAAIGVYGYPGSLHLESEH